MNPQMPRISHVLPKPQPQAQGTASQTPTLNGHVLFLPDPLSPAARTGPEIPPKQICFEAQSSPNELNVVYEGARMADSDDGVENIGFPQEYGTRITYDMALDMSYEAPCSSTDVVDVPDTPPRVHLCLHNTEDDKDNLYETMDPVHAPPREKTWDFKRVRPTPRCLMLSVGLLLILSIILGVTLHQKASEKDKGGDGDGDSTPATSATTHAYPLDAIDNSNWTQNIAIFPEGFKYDYNISNTIMSSTSNIVRWETLMNDRRLEALSTRTQELLDVDDLHYIHGHHRFPGNTSMASLVGFWASSEGMIIIDGDVTIEADITIFRRCSDLNEFLGLFAAITGTAYIRVHPHMSTCDVVFSSLRYIGGLHVRGAISLGQMPFPSAINTVVDTIDIEHVIIHNRFARIFRRASHVLGDIIVGSFVGSPAWNYRSALTIHARLVFGNLRIGHDIKVQKDRDGLVHNAAFLQLKTPFQAAVFVGLSAVIQNVAWIRPTPSTVFCRAGFRSMRQIVTSDLFTARISSGYPVVYGDVLDMVYGC